MKSGVLALSFLLAAGLSAAQQPPQPQQSPQQPQAPLQRPTEKCTVEGRVVKLTGEPLKKARISLRRAEGRDPGYAASTDASGKFLLKEVEPGRFRLFVERQGYVRQEYGQRGPGRPGSILTLQPGQNQRELVFKMIPAAVITGRVFDEDGEPLQYVSVQAMRYAFLQGRRQLMSFGGATTNDLGEYRLFGLAPGRYFLSATFSPGMTMVGGGAVFTSPEGRQEEAYAPTYFPGTTDPGRAAAIDLRAGEESRGVDFTFTPTRAFRIRGRVFNSITSQPGRGAQVMLLPRDLGSRGFFMRNQAAVDAQQGTFELRNVIPGSYMLTASWFDEGKVYSARLPIDVGGADIEGVQLTIGPGLDLPGQVRVEAGDVTLTDLRINLQSREDSIMFGGTGPGSVKADGTFVLQNVAEGNYDVAVFGFPDGYYVKSVRAGTDETLDAGLNVMRGKAIPALEVVLSGAGGRVEGLVTNADALPISGALVVLIPERRTQTNLYKTTTTDQYGRFALKGIRPGEYKLFAWEDIEPGIYQDAEFLKPLESRGQMVRIEESSGNAVEMKVIPATPPGK